MNTDQRSETNQRHDDDLRQVEELVTRHITDAEVKTRAESLMQRLRGRLDASREAEKAHSESRRRAAVERAFFARAAREQLLAPDDALKLLDDPKLEVDEAGKVRGLDELFADLRRARPWLFARTATPGIEQRGLASDPSESLREQAARSGLTRDIQLWRESRRR